MDPDDKFYLLAKEAAKEGRRDEAVLLVNKCYNKIRAFNGLACVAKEEEDYSFYQKLANDLSIERDRNEFDATLMLGPVGPW